MKLNLPQTWLLSIVLLCVASVACAQRNYLCLYSNDKQQDNSWEIEQVRKLTFSSTGVEIHLRDGGEPSVCPFTNVCKFTFESQPLPSSIMVSESALLECLFYDFLARAVLTSAKQGVLRLYAMDGMLVRSILITEGQTSYFVGDMPSGIYIVNLISGLSQSQSIKIVIR